MPVTAGMAFGPRMGILASSIICCLYVAFASPMLLLSCLVFRLGLFDWGGLLRVPIFNKLQASALSNFADGIGQVVADFSLSLHHPTGHSSMGEREETCLMGLLLY